MYGFARGRVSDVWDQWYQVELDAGKSIGVKRWPEIRDSFQKENRVIALWDTPGGRLPIGGRRGDLYTWLIPQTKHEPRSYRKPHPADPPGFQFEEKLWIILNSQGIYCEPATRFEDTGLGVDLWVMLRKHLPHLPQEQQYIWRWVPFDVTIGKKGRGWERKIKKKEEQLEGAGLIFGVLLLPEHFDLTRLLEVPLPDPMLARQIAKRIEIFLAYPMHPSLSLLTREQARELEREWSAQKRQR